MAEIFIRNVTATDNRCAIVRNHDFIVHSVIETAEFGLVQKRACQNRTGSALVGIVDAILDIFVLMNRTWQFS